MIARVLKVYSLLGCLIIFGSLWLVDVKMTFQIGITICVFGINLYWLSASVSTFVKSCASEESTGSSPFLSSIRLFVFLVAIILILFAFGGVPVLIGNSLTVCTLIGTVLFSHFIDKQD